MKNKRREADQKRKNYHSKTPDIKGKIVTKNHYLNIFVLTGSKRGPMKLGGNYLKSIKLEEKYVV